MKVIIDSGHGGSETGAFAFETLEKDLNLVFSKLLAGKLRKLGVEVDTSLINDIYYNSVQLTDLIRQSGAKLCISCHNNSFNGSARGLETIYGIHSDGILAKGIIGEVSKTGFTVRKAYSRESSINPGTDYYFIIRLTYPQVETIIIEFGFMDNAEDFKMLTDPNWQDQLTSAAAAAIRSYIPVESPIKTSIAGSAVLTSGQLKNALKDNNAQSDPGIVDIYYQIAPLYEIKSDLAFLQAMVETNWLKFTGIVKPQQNNFSGLGSTGGSNAGASFPTVTAGVEAHIQHLFAYSSTAPLPTGRTLVDPRFSYVKRGIAPNWEDLDGKWAVPGTNYGETIVSLQKPIAQKYPEKISVHWAKEDNDELMAAGLLKDDHTKTLDSFATEGMIIALINRLRKELKKNG